MSDSKYQGGVRAGIAGSISAGAWPGEIQGLGVKRGGIPLERCADCPADAHPFKATTHVSYGGKPAL